MYMVIGSEHNRVVRIKRAGSRVLPRTYKSGYYYVINLDANDDKAVKEFDRLALISSDVIRHLVIRKDK